MFRHALKVPNQRRALERQIIRKLCDRFVVSLFDFRKQRELCHFKPEWRENSIVLPGHSAGSHTRVEAEAIASDPVKSILNIVRHETIAF
jgi:hypothetical protein